MEALFTCWSWQRCWFLCEGFSKSAGLVSEAVSIFRLGSWAERQHHPSLLLMACRSLWGTVSISCLKKNSPLLRNTLAAILGAILKKCLQVTLSLWLPSAYFWTSTKHLRDVQFVGQDISSPSIGSFVSGHETSISLHTGSLGTRFCGVYAGSGGGRRRQETEEWCSNREMSLSRNKWLHRTLCKLMQDAHTILLHNWARVWPSTFCSVYLCGGHCISLKTILQPVKCVAPNVIWPIWFVGLLHIRMWQ